MQPRKTSPAPIKVFETTKHQLRLMAAVSRRSQAEIVESAVDEYLERHAEEFALGLERARDALLGGRIDAVAHLLGEDPEAIRRVSGTSTGR